MGDIGELGSLDPVALDRACIDLIYKSDVPGRDTLIERIESRYGLHIGTYCWTWTGVYLL